MEAEFQTFPTACIGVICKENTFPIGRDLFFENILRQISAIDLLS